MSQTPGATANIDQAAYWNAGAGETWAALQDKLDRQIGPLGEAALRAVAPTAGARVIDVGCGCGQTTIALARLVGTAGTVLGIDLSRPMLAVARRRIAEQGLAQASAIEADAQTHVFAAGSFDGVFSRFGVMFFANPTAAFANLLGALKPGGRLGFVWRAFAENPLMGVPLQAALPHFAAPPPPSDPLAPGPFAFADRERLAGILADAGFTEVAIDAQDLKMGSPHLDEAVETALRVGPVGALLREQPEKRAEVLGPIREALAPHLTADGVRLASATWIVSARRP